MGAKFANNRTTLIYSTNLEISPAASCSVYGRGVLYFGGPGLREREGEGKNHTERNIVNKMIVIIFNKEKKGNGKV